MSTELEEELKSVLETLKNVEIDSILQNFRDSPTEIEAQECSSLLDEIREKSAKALQRLVVCPLSSKEQILNAYRIIDDHLYLPKKPNFFELRRLIKDIVSAILSIMGLKEFRYTSPKHIDTKKSLEQYINAGMEIRNDPNFPGSPLDELEKIAMDAESYFDKDENKVKYRVIDGSNLKRTFIALSAPSFEGKTQSPFVFKTVRPLYFLANYECCLNDPGIQFIYRNYRDVSKTMLDFAKEDYKLIGNDRHLEGTKGITGNDLVSGPYLEKYHMKTKFWILGFLKELIEDARLNYDLIPESNRLDWMDYHANRKNLFIESASLEELKLDKTFFKGYCLFLDEFFADSPAFLIRNLARLLGLRCIVANTKTSITNVTENNESGTSREIDVWSIVIVHLNPMSRGVMENVFHIKELTENILMKCNESERSKFEFFIDALAGERGKIALTRPGLVEIVIEAINDIIKSVDVITIRELVEEIVISLGYRLSIVKGRIGSVNGEMAILSLFTDHSYDFDFDADNETNSLYHRKSFLSDHLFHLINPVCQENFLFLTYQPVDLNANLIIYVDDGTLVRQDWKHVSTYFRYNDILSILSFAAIPTMNPILFSLINAIDRGDIDGAYFSDQCKLDATRLDVNHLETLSACIVIDASHSFKFIKYYSWSTKFSLSGQGGIIFIQNILTNCTTGLKLRGQSNAILEIISNTPEEFEIQNFLENLIIPFLCPLDCEIPDLLSELKSDNFTDDSAHIGKYSRASNTEQFDAHFDCYLNDERFAKTSKLYSSTSPAFKAVFKAVIEYKNWASPITSTKVYEIINNILNSDSDGQKISFIFCDSITNPEEVNETLSEFCYKTNILIYRFIKSRDLSFKLTPYYCDLETQNPKMICFVFELKEINKFRS